MDGFYCMLSRHCVVCDGKRCAHDAGRVVSHTENMAHGFVGHGCHGRHAKHHTRSKKYQRAAKVTAALVARLMVSAAPVRNLAAFVRRERLPQEVRILGVLQAGVTPRSLADS